MLSRLKAFSWLSSPQLNGLASELNVTDFKRHEGNAASVVGVGAAHRCASPSNNRTPKKLAGTEEGGSLPDARRVTHHLTASAARLLEE
jgi:hypothetical protein